MFINAIFLVLILSQTVLSKPPYLRYSIGNDTYITKNTTLDINGRGEDVVIKVGYVDISKYKISVSNAKSVSYSDS